MPYAPFHDAFPEVAERETRSVTVMEGTRDGLPPDQYGLLELYCDERGCDCRRVMFYVVTPRSKEPLAVIAYGWESPQFYNKWLRFDDPATLRELKGPALNRLSPQSPLAPAILDLVENLVLRDGAYVERLERHYWMFRGHVDGRQLRKSKKKRSPR